MKTIYAYWVTMTIALVACTGNEKNQLSDLPIVAHQVEVDGQEMTVCELGLLKDTIDLPLSYWVEDFETVKLDGKDEALVGHGPVYVSDNYILVRESNNVPCKLFRRDGSFVGKVGSLGLGPGEYTDVYDMQIDEQAEHIYLLPFRSKAIYVYDLKGNYQKDIPLNKKYEKMMVPKGLFKVDAAKNRVAVMTLPFDYLPLVAWVQDMEGNFLHEVPMNHLKIRPAFSNEMLSSKCFADALDVSLYTLKEVRKDTLYHLDMNDGKLYPKFTLDFGGRDITRHNYFDFSTHYAGSLAAIEQVGENSFMVNA
ncbi:MAG: 6-bladed beta-propeller, partial [Bacteroides sp.]|nr:6-bladed beta-propeller [Bacteroides sp.]